MPPPPPAPGPPRPVAPIAAGGRGDLLAAIQRGAALKKADTAENLESPSSAPAPTPGGNDLLAAIRKGPQQLKSASPSASPAPPLKKEMSVLEQIQARQREVC